MNNNNETTPFEVDVLKLLLAFLKRWWIIAICTIVFAAGAYAYTAKCVTPMYRASVTIYVNSTKQTLSSESVNISNISIAKSIINTYVNIIYSDTVLEKVIDSANLDLSVEQLRSLMSAGQVDDTEMFKVYVVHSNPEKAAYIANAVADIAPGEIERFIVGSSTKIIDGAKVPAYSYSPNYRKNTMVGAAIGALLAMGVISLFVLLDVRVKDEKDLATISDLPMLGQIPDFSELSNHSGYSHKHSKYDTYAEKQDGGTKK